VHLQLFCSLVGLGRDVPGVGVRSDLPVWKSLCPDPNLVLRWTDGLAAPAPAESEHLAAQRRLRLSPALSLSYTEPLTIVRGDGAYLYDESGRGWLDLVNNVAHVGHCHPRVVAAAGAQQAALNTNTRYLHGLVVEYARRLAETLPDPLTVCFFTNSGSEANDLALRLAYAHTRSREMFVLDHAYHGNLTSLVDVSPYKFRGPGGWPTPPHTHVVPLACAFRGRLGVQGAGPYLTELERMLEVLARQGKRPAALLAEAIPGTAGQVVLEPGFLAGAYSRVRAAGGLVIADEVQTGFGRVGDAFWAFQPGSSVGRSSVGSGAVGSNSVGSGAGGSGSVGRGSGNGGQADNGQAGSGTTGGSPAGSSSAGSSSAGSSPAGSSPAGSSSAGSSSAGRGAAGAAMGLVPDIVTMGKPIGNGHPIGAVVTTAEVAHSFLTGMEYFNTFGGNPVSAAVGLAVLDVIADEGLQRHAGAVGGSMMAGLREVGARHAAIGDVRGRGLFLGVELVATATQTTAVVEAVKRRGILLSSDGPDHNVLKIKPPMVISAADGARVVAAIDEAVGEVLG
jgi:4-aminobutyrate aminotransferase-like enzyme